MEIFWPAPEDNDTSALCSLVVYPSTACVLTWDDDGRELWWHMDFRDPMIPLLLAELDSEEQQ